MTSAVDKSQRHQINFLDMLRIESWAAGCEARMLPLSYAAPRYYLQMVSIP